MNIIILGSGYEWLEISLQKLARFNNVHLVNERFPVDGKVRKKLAWVHYSNKLNKIIQIPFKGIWYKQIIKKTNIENHKNERNCIIIYDQNMIGGDFQFIKKIKREYPESIFVYMFTNVAEISAAAICGYIDNLNECYDIVYAFDHKDAEKYNFLYSPLIYDPQIDAVDTRNQTVDSVFYLGQAKDRYNMLIQVFQRINDLGILTDFNIVNVPEDKIVYDKMINYNHPMKYLEAIEHIKKSSCLIDVVQGNSSGLTIKTCEAVFFNKKLITTNKEVAEYPFYDMRYIKIIEKASDIDLSFFVDNHDIEYSEEGKRVFLTESFIKRLEQDIKKLNRYNSGEA